MKPKIMYVENKSNGHGGLAWIGFAEFSKSGQTVYFDNKALKRLKIPGIWGNYFDIETGEEYWVSGVKRNGQDRHQFGGGPIMLDKHSVQAYLELVDFETIDKNKFMIIEVSKTDKSRFNKMENAEVEFENESLEARYWDNNRKKLL